MPATSGTNRRLSAGLAVGTAVVVALGLLPGAAGPVQAQAARPGPEKAGAASKKAVVRTGTVRILHEDDFANKRTKHRVVLQADGKDFRLDGVAAASAPKAGSTVRVSGAELGAAIEVSGLTTLAPPPAAAAMAAATGPRRTAVVLINFSNNQARPFTAADALNRVFTGPDSANAYFKESSNGALSLVGRESAAGDVFGWYTIPQYSSPCDQARWAISAREAARAGGHDLTAYDNVVYIFPVTNACPWAGLAYIGNGPYGMGEAWSNGWLDTGLITHELGHNFGMHHASTLSCGAPGQRATMADINSCAADEYGDPFDVMGDPMSLQRGGNRYGRQPHSWHRQQSGMLPAGAVTTVTQTGDYTLTAAELETGTRSLRVALPWFSPYYYYLELRTPEGRFDDFPATAPVVQGISIRLSMGPEDAAVSPSYLLDATPATTTFQDAALAVGREFYDPNYGRLAVKVKSISGGVAVVHVEVDAVGASVVSVEPSGNTVVPRTSNVVVTFSAPMNRTSVESAFSLSSYEGAPGVFSWNPTSTVLTFDPTMNLLAYSYYSVNVGQYGLPPLDAAGRFLAAPWQSGFSTDSAGPKVVAMDPVEYTDAGVDTNVSITFDTPVDRDSAQRAFTLRSYKTDATVAGAFSWNATSTVLTFNPTANLAGASGYVVTFSADVRDMAGLSMPGTFFSSFNTVGTSPAVVGRDPVYGATSADVAGNVVLTFSEPMDRNSVESGFSLADNNLRLPVGGAFSWDVGSTVVTFDPSAELAGKTWYDVRLGASVIDAAGDLIFTPWSTFFVTGDAGPTVSAEPAAGAAGVPVDRNVVVTFSEPMERGSAQAAFSLRKAGTTVNLGGSFTWDAAATVMTFNPYSNLLANSGYTVGVATTAKDAAGNQMAETFGSSFTSDAQGPTVSVEAASGATAVPVDRNVVVTFSEPVERNSAQAAFSLRRAGTTVNLGGSFAWDLASRVMTYNPYANLVEASAYTIALAPSVKDVAGNPMAGPHSSGFTTSGQAPSVSTVEPSVGATGVAVDRNVVVTFTEPMERGSTQAAFSLRKAGTTVNLGGAFTWDAASTVMTFNPYANLLANSGYAVAVATTARDTAGTPAGAAFASGFTSDAQPPTVTGAEPTAAEVAVDRNVVVTFSEPMERGSAQGAFSLRKAGTTVNLGGAFTWDTASTVMTFNPYANLLANTGYAVAVATSAKDIAGNPMAAAFESSFTSDAQGPTVTVDAGAGAGAIEVPVDRNVVVTFSEPVERNSAQAAFSLRRAGTTVNLGGAFTWDAASRIMTFNPYANLVEASAYTIALAPSVKDLAGNPMAGPHSSGFTTSGQAPSVSTVDPSVGATGVAVDRNVVVTFTEPMERGSTQAAFSLRKSGTTVNLGGSFAWDTASRVMTFNPYANLLATSGYAVAVSISARDTAGTPAGAAFASEFTSDAQAPATVGVNPTAGTDDVAVDRNVVVTFSEAMERSSAQGAFSLRKAGTTVNLGGAFTWDAASTVMTFNPYANLLANAGYSVAVAASAKDIAGNPMVATFASSFTSDAQGPTVTVDAAAGATAVPVDRNVVVTFSEPVERNSAQGAFSLRRTGTTVNLGGAFTWDAASRIMTFNPYANLGEASAYTIALAPSVKDLAGNPMAGPHSSGFTTSGQAPSVVGADPPAEAVGVAVDRNVVVAFSEAMERGSTQAAFSLRKAGTTVNLGGSFTWDAASTVMTFNPFANLAANSGYSVAVAASAKDTAGNPATAAFATEFTSDAQAPDVTVAEPAPGAIAVPVDRNVVVTFSEPVERNSAQAAFSLRRTGTTVNLGGAFTWDAASRVLTFNPYANLGEAAVYTVSLAQSVKDLAGNPMAGPFSSSFTTGGQAPSVSTVDPSVGATGVAVARNVVVTFSEPMERGSTQAAFSLRKAGTTVNLGGSFTWDAASTVMTFNPYANLLAASGYTVAVATSARDTVGTPAAVPAGWDFQTGP